MTEEDYLTLTTNQKINVLDNHIESINASRNPAQEQRIPTKSSELLKTIYNLSPADLGEKARDITELQPPETQGKNALALAEHIIQKGSSFKPDKPELYRRALFFKELYDSNTCYICGYPIDKMPHAEELEHVLPIAEALALTAIIQLKGKEFKRNLDEISNSTDAYLYLLEYARAHTCCNQVKGVVSFISFNGTPPYKEPYKIDNNSISQVLKNIWINFGHGGKLQQFEHACANRTLIDSYFSKISLSKFVEERKSIIIRDFMNPILSEIKNFVGTNGLQFSQLCYIANQALSIDQNIWGHLGSRWRGREIDDLSDLKRMIIEKIVPNTRSSYDNTIGSVIDEILKIYNSKTNLELNSKINEHFTKQLAAERARPIRTLDKPTFSRIINIEYISFFDIHIRYLTARNNQEILAYSRVPFIFFGVEYIFYLLNSQKSDFKFNTAMIDPLIEMIYNVNKYTIYYIFLYFIIYNPFINKTTFDSPDNASTVVLDELNQNIYTPYEEIQLNFVTNVFDNFNFLSDISSVFKLDLQILSNYGSYISTSPTTIIAAETLATIFFTTKTRLNSELTAIESQPPAGGKKHKKNKTKKHKKSKRKSTGRTIKRRKTTK